MKWWTCAAVLVGLVVGLAIPYVVGNAVQAEQEKGVKWEYRAAMFEWNPPSKGQRVVSKQLNDLAAEGWEYVGPLAVPAGKLDVVQGLVMFKRSEEVTRPMGSRSAHRTGLPRMGRS
jgi:hypothetical protein